MKNELKDDEYYFKKINDEIFRLEECLPLGNIIRQYLYRARIEIGSAQMAFRQSDIQNISFKSNLGKLYDYVNKIVDEVFSIDENNWDVWEPAYDKIFHAYRESDIVIEWYDPDSSYKEDVLAFYNALKETYNNE